MKSGLTWHPRALRPPRLKERAVDYGDPAEPVSLVQGLNEFDEAGYSGPLPAEDRGPHRYFFRLFALDAELDLPPGVGRSELRRAAKAHTLAQVELVGIA